MRRDPATLSCVCSCAVAWDFVDANRCGSSACDFRPQNYRHDDALRAHDHHLHQAVAKFGPKTATASGDTKPPKMP